MAEEQKNPFEPIAELLKDTMERRLGEIDAERRQQIAGPLANARAARKQFQRDGDAGRLDQALGDLIEAVDDAFRPRDA